MEKYDDLVVDAYINGDVLGDYSIDELEDDPKFMRLVMDKTNDVKVNGDFVKYIVLKFKDNNEFIKKVVQRYLYHLDMIELNEEKNMSFNRASIAKIMIDITKDVNQNDYLEYNKILRSMYSFYRTKVELEKRSEDYNEEANLGYGFEYFSCLFGDNEDLISYFATVMVNEILDDHTQQLEDFLHSNYVSFDSINDLDGEVIDFINIYDSNLEKYLLDDISVLHDGYEVIVDFIRREWVLHDLDVERKMYDEVLNRIHNIILSTYDAIFNEEAILVNLGYKYGIIDKIAKYNVLDMKFVELLNSEFDDAYFKKIMEYSDIDRDLYLEAESIIKEVLFGNSNVLKKELK